MQLRIKKVVIKFEFNYYFANKYLIDSILMHNANT